MNNLQEVLFIRSWSYPTSLI